jgi:cytochrome P450
MQLTKRTARISLGFAELKVDQRHLTLLDANIPPQKYMLGMIHDRENSYQNYNDLFSNLLAANANDSEGLKLTNEELTGNIFIFLIGEELDLYVVLLLTTSSAGHETTAHTLAFAAALLALYPEVQEKLYQHVKVTVADPSGAPVCRSTTPSSLGLI